MSTGLIMIIAGAIGSLVSLICFFRVKMKNSEEINFIYSEAVGTTVVAGSTVKAIRNTNSEKIKLTEIKETAFEPEETAYAPEETEMMDVQVEETELL